MKYKRLTVRFYVGQREIASAQIIPTDTHTRVEVKRPPDIKERYAACLCLMYAAHAMADHDSLVSSALMQLIDAFPDDVGLPSMPMEVMKSVLDTIKGYQTGRQGPIFAGEIVEEDGDEPF